jgi:hypothetical protein
MWQKVCNYAVQGVAFAQSLQMDPATTSLVQQLMQAYFRHVLGGLAGSLVTLGLLAPSNTAAFINIGLGLVSGAVVLWWTTVQKQRVTPTLLNYATIESKLSNLPPVPASIPGAPSINAAIAVVKTNNQP